MSGKSARKKRDQDQELRFAREQAVTLGAYCAHLGKKMFARPGNKTLARIDLLLREHNAFSAFVRTAQNAGLKLPPECAKAMKGVLELHVMWERGKQKPELEQPKNRLKAVDDASDLLEDVEVSYVCTRCRSTAPGERTIASSGWELREQVWYHRCPDALKDGFIHPRKAEEGMANLRTLFDDLVAQNLEQIAEGNLEPNDALTACIVAVGDDPDEVYANAKPGETSNEAATEEVPEAGEPAEEAPEATQPEQTISPAGVESEEKVEQQGDEEGIPLA